MKRVKFEFDERSLVSVAKLREAGHEVVVVPENERPVFTMAAIQALRDAGGDAWDEVEDVEAFLEDMCGPR